MVCTVDHLATAAGVAMLRAGGSAADAAVAASAVLAVTTQHMCGMGGDLLAVIAPPAGPPVVLNASGRAGSGADADRLRADGHVAMVFREDIRSVPIPGCVDGWAALHSRFGRLPWADVLAPARRYADDGFPASPTLAAATAAIAQHPAAADYRAAGALRPGDLVRRPGIGRALAAVAAEGRDGFYGGEFGAGLLALGAGEYQPEDLARSQADWVEPVAAEAWGHRVWTAPPNSQGYLTPAAAWIAAGLALPEDPDDPRWPHVLVEASRQAAADRLEVLHEQADGDQLLAPERLGPRRGAIDIDHAAPLGGSYGPGGTIALCCVDETRLGISLLQSNAAGFGSHLAEPATGIFLQNRGVGFNLIPGHPAEYGPGRRPPHTLCPTLVTGPDGALAGVVGTMGGDSQPQILLQLLARWLVTRQPPGDAVGAGRWILSSTNGGTGFDTWARGGEVRVVLEGHAPGGWDAGLAARGHDVIRVGPYAHGFGHAHLITVTDGRLAGATDPRPRFGAAAGF
jgi:gamma-glutamyltranspeptidase/glutathione hydrolase